ncbi:hypothetical protein P9J64_00785 [Deltaproteobacteria bacterium IMCC39524]|nr:hypothetical protein [Deltaproteobacteria bacterium IMCC39524]
MSFDSGGIAFHPFAGGAALHRTGGHRLWVLNSSSAVLWCLLEELGDTYELVGAYAAHFRITSEQAHADVKLGLDHFVRAGLLREVVEETQENLPLDVVDPLNRSTYPLPIVKSSSTAVRSFQLGGLSWQVTCSDSELGETWLSPFTHLSAAFDELHWRFDLMEVDNEWTICGDGELWSEQLSADQVLPSLQAVLFGLLCAAQEHRLLLHAAVLVRDGQALLLPAEAGSGKSTLTLALAAHGWQVYSDELAPLDPVLLKVDPFPLPIGIKSRSLSSLAAWYPELGEVPAHRRADGQQVRFLGDRTAPLAASNAAPAKVSRLIFPCYKENTETRLRRLEPLHALELLACTGSSQRALTETDVAALLTLAEKRECWLLEYTEVAEAVKALREESLV